MRASCSSWDVLLLVPQLAQSCQTALAVVMVRVVEEAEH